MYTEKKPTKALKIILVLAISLIVFSSGYLIGASSGYIVGINMDDIFKSSKYENALLKSEQASETVLNNKAVDFDLFWNVWNTVQTKHYDKTIEDVDLFYGAIAGIADAADDPYTSFFTPEEAKVFNEDINGEFSGIGAEIGIKDAQITIIAPLQDTPADQAGILPGDFIIKIDDIEMYDKSIDEAVDLIRGPKGSTVVLTIYREGDTDFQEISIIRDVIKVPTVDYELLSRNEKTIGYIKLHHFNVGSSKEFSKTAQQVLLDNPDGIILDLRSNPGGLLDESITIASEFIGNGLIVTEKNNDGEVKGHYSKKGGNLINQDNMVVLINQGSASASEIVAGALQDYKRAIVIGRTSFGKGSVQEYEVFDDGSSLKVTVAKWFTPNNQNIDETGIIPDIEVDITREDYEQEKDPQLERAVEELIK